MFILHWHDEGRSIDDLDPSLFRVNDDVEHVTRWRGSGGPVIAYASVQVDGPMAILDYGGQHERANQKTGVDIVALELMFADSERVALRSVRIMGNDQTQVEFVDTAELIFEEGERSLIPHFRRERDSRLRALKLKELASNRCAVCETELTQYGENAPSFEVHHRSAIALGSRSTGTENLAVLCPNCHRAIHKTGTKKIDVPEFKVWFRQLNQLL